MRYTEEELLQLLRQDREEGAAALLEQYAGLLWTVCHRRLENAEDIRECVNSTFADVCLHPEKYDPQKGSLKNYLCRIADRKAIDRYHDNCRRQQAEEEVAQQSQRDQENAEHADAMAEHLEEALEHLEPLDNQILRMKYYDGLSYQEIAAQLGLSEGTVKMRSMRSRKKLVKILLLLLALAMLAACAVAALRQYRFHERRGISWNDEEVIYEMAGNSIVWEQDDVRYEITDALYQQVTGDVFDYELRIYVRVTWLGEEEEGWSVLFPARVKETLETMRMTEVREEGVMNNLLTAGWRYLPGTEYLMETHADIELKIPWVLEPDENNEIHLELYMDIGRIGEITLQPTALVDYEEPTESYELLDGLDWKLGPSVAGTDFTIVTLSQQDAGSWTISPFLVSSPGGRAGRDGQELYLMAEDGTTYQKARTSYSLHEPTEGWLQHQYELYFRDVPAGEYTMYIPYLFLRRDWKSEDFTLTLPQVSDQKLECDVTALFPDGSGLHITGITRTEEEMITYDWYEETEELVEVRRLYWRYTLEMECLSVGELEFWICLLETDRDNFMFVKQEMGVLSFSILQQEAPESIVVRLTEPDYVLDKEYTVPVTIQESQRETPSVQ